MAVGLRTRVQGIYQGWWVAAAGFGVLALLTGSQSGGSIGIFFVALLRQFGWSRTLLSGAFSLVRIEGSFLGPLEGFLTDRLGSHRMTLIGFLVAGTGFFLLSQVSHPVHFYLAMLTITGGVGLGSYIPVMSAVNWWFSRHRNAAIGIAMAGFSMGAVWSPLIAWMVITHGWRTAAITIGVVLWAAAFPLSRMLRRPSAGQLSQYTRETVASSTGVATQETAPEADFTIRQAVRTRAFWIIPLAQAANGFTTTAVQVHGIPHLVEIGLSLQTAGFVMALFGIIEVCMRVFGSFIGDRVDKRYAILMYNTIQALGVVVLALAHSLPVALLFTLLFAVGHGGRGPLFVAIRGEFYGRNRFGTIMGIGSFITGISGVATPLLLGILFDMQGTYKPGLLSMAAITFIGGFLILFAVRPTVPGTSGPQPTGA